MSRVNLNSARRRYCVWPYFPKAEYKDPLANRSLADILGDYNPEKAGILQTESQKAMLIIN